MKSKEASFKIILCVSSFFVLTVLGFVYMHYLISHSMNSYVDYDYCETAQRYLEEKYKKEIVIDKYVQNYAGSPAVYVHFENDSLQFVSYGDYDFFLSTYLNTIAQDTIKLACEELINVHHVVCTLKANADERMATYYMQTNELPSWKNPHGETIESVYIYYVHDYSLNASQVQKLLNELVENLDEKAILEGSHIFFSKHNAHNTRCHFKVTQGTVLCVD